MKIYDFPEKIKSDARTLVSQAVAQKQIIVPRRCEACLYDIAMLYEEEGVFRLGNNSARGKRCLLEAHHYNYNYPLSVWWLCPTCHKMIHVIQRRLQIACIGLNGLRSLLNEYRYQYEHEWLNDLDDAPEEHEQITFW